MNALLVDRNCAILDGKCNCQRFGDGLPFCKFGTSNALELKKIIENRKEATQVPQK